VRRIRLSSLGPRAFGRELVEVLRDPLFCPHWHIPLQSGDDGVLSIMRRGYTRSDYLGALALVEERFDRPAITTDIIVGHPGETEAAFERTLDLARRAGFARIHVFPFSPREGTPAARLAGRVPAEEIARREWALKELERELAVRYKKLFVDRTVEVLVEGVPPGATTIEGFTERYLRVRAPAKEPSALHNTFVRTRVTEVRPDLVDAELVNANE
jgi:threonylcarbamoyladenosine tRNA methylthiotransferase MtaB